MNLNRNLASQAEIGNHANLLSSREGQMVGGMLMPKNVRSNSSFEIGSVQHRNNLLSPLSKSAMSQLDGIRNKRVHATQASQSRYKQQAKYQSGQLHPSKFRISELSPRAENQSPRSQIGGETISPEKSPRSTENFQRSVMDLKARAALRKAQSNRPDIPSVEDFVRKKDDWGIQGYKISKYHGIEDIHREGLKLPQRSDMNRQKKESIIDSLANKRKNDPSPFNYSPDADKIGETRKIYHQLYKTSKKTSLHEFAEIEKKKGMGPVHYKPTYALQTKRVKGHYDSLNRYTFLEETMTAGNAVTVPSPNQYQLPSLDITKPKSQRPLIIEESAKRKEMAIAKWAKNNDPNPCSYETSAKLKLTEDNSAKMFVFKKSKKTTLTDEIMNRAKKTNLPASNQYKVGDIEKNLLYKPLSKRI